MYPLSSSVFASVRRHFDDPRIADAVLVTVPVDAERAEPVRLTATEAHEALYGQGSDPRFAAAVWQKVLRTALRDLAPQGTGKLLVIWLALPRLTGTVHRVCTRLRADRSDVEAEMVLALLEELAAPDFASRLCDSSLIHAARARAWHFAREKLRELPSNAVERIAQDRALTASGAEADAPAEDVLDVRVERPDGLCAPLRFRVRPEHLRKSAFADIDDGTRDRSTHPDSWKKRRPGRHAGTRPVRPAGRRS
ncbi:hypothetical protein ME763_08545 [Streptomyces murinus]|uniref:hypothetical protein n=1 Tax=Streptomyces murinus TaxID=33900 RepID=UPI00117D8945|nr:hypothetical protein [Streptomyces murinus]WDO05706.1 hypothetical protein ME763_08545 [Streptomyces murinus]